MLLLKEPIFEREKKGTKNVNFLCDFFFFFPSLKLQYGQQQQHRQQQRKEKKERQNMFFGIAVCVGKASR